MTMPIMTLPMKRPSFYILTVFLTLSGLALPLPAVFAEDPQIPPGIEIDEDHETARKALEQREVLPLGEVLAKIEQEQPGDVIEIELERKGGVWIYELELIDTDGRVRELDIDARSGEILKISFEE